MQGQEHTHRTRETFVGPSVHKTCQSLLYKLGKYRDNKGSRGYIILTTKHHYNFIQAIPRKLPLLPCRCPNGSLIPLISTEAHLAPHVYGFCEALNLPDLTATRPQWLFNKMAHRVEWVYSSAVLHGKWIGREGSTAWPRSSPWHP
jgi:hypothetical protein